MSNVHHFQQRLEQSRVAKSVLRPADQVHWDILVSRVCEPEVARLIVRFLDKAPSEKLKHAGLYLRANLVLGDAFAKAEEEARQKRKSRLHVMVRALTSIGVYLYRCIRLPFRAGRDVKSLVFPQRSGRHLFIR